MYSVQKGDTFASISRRQYGSESYAGLIAQANPGTGEPLIAGDTLVIPDRPGSPVNVLTRALSGSPEEVAVLINGKRFRYWSRLRVAMAADSLWSFEFSAPFEPDDATFRATFRPFSYRPVVITVGGEPLFTGVMVSIVPDAAPTRRTVAVSGYAKPGPMEDCTCPASAFPLEFNDARLKTIAVALAAPFGVSVVTRGDLGPAFERAAPDPTDSPLPFLVDLARQRSRIITNDESGRLVLQQSVSTGTPVAELSEGSSPLIDVRPAFSPQQYFSHITGIESATIGFDGSQFTVKNPHLPGVLRPHTFASPDVQGGEIKTATEAKAGRMFGSAASYVVTVSTWRDPSGALWTPNTTLKLVAPGAMIYASYEFIVRSVTLEKEADREMATLELVLPGAFSGTLPEALPWD